MRAGERVTVIKLEPGEREVARYPAVVASEHCPEPWFALEAVWETQRVEQGGLVFAPGDRLIEYFSPDHWFNVFRVIAGDGSLRGHYGNVTRPTRIALSDDVRTVTWHDLYLDVIRLPNGQVELCDEAELRESGLAESDPDLYRQIREVAKELMDLALSGEFPFQTPDS